MQKGRNTIKNGCLRPGVFDLGLCLFLDDDLELLLVDKAALDVSILSVDAKPKRLCTD
jgi:hypothetical protein